MATDTSDHRPSVYPVLRYDDAHKAIAFLTEAFGFTALQVFEGEGGTVEHAQLGWGTGVVMLSSSSSGDPMFDTGPATVYVAVDDADAHHARSVAAGAEIIMPLTDQSYGSRDYSAKDPEGTIWSFGTYRPAADGSA